MRALPVRARILVVLFLFVIAGVSVYAAAMHNEFVMDDVHLVYQNPLIRSFSFVLPCFSQPFLKVYYRPLTHLSFMLDYGMWKLDPFGYHVTSLILHICNAGMVFFLLYLLWGDMWLAALAGLLLVVHPIGGIPVNYVADRSNLLGAFFVLCALTSFLAAFRRNKVEFYFSGYLFFISALLSHESTIIFPVYLTCLLAVIYSKKETKRILTLIGPVVMISAGYFVLRMMLLNRVSLVADMAAFLSWKSVSSFFFMIFRYVSLVVYPRDIALIFTIDPAFVHGIRGFMYVLFAVTSAAAAMIACKRRIPVLFGMAWFVLGCLPLYYLMFSRPEMGLIMQDNWGYVPSIGLIIILSFCLIRLKSIVALRVWLALVLAVVIYYAGMNAAHTALWKNENAYCSYWLTVAPKNPYALNTRGAMYGKRGDYKRAKEYFWKGVDCFRKKGPSRRGDAIMGGPLLGILYNNLGRVAEKEGHRDDAIKYYKNAVIVDDNNAEGHARLAGVYAGMGDVDKAIFHYNESIRINYYRLDAHRQLAFLYGLKGDKAAAREAVRAALSIDPHCYGQINGKTHALP